MINDLIQMMCRIVSWKRRKSNKLSTKNIKKKKLQSISLFYFYIFSRKDIKKNCNQRAKSMFEMGGEKNHRSIIWKRTNKSKAGNKKMLEKDFTPCCSFFFFFTFQKHTKIIVIISYTLVFWLWFWRAKLIFFSFFFYMSNKLRSLK